MRRSTPPGGFPRLTGMSTLNVSRRARIRVARRAGFSSGVASVFRVLGRGRPAPPLVRRGLGSLRGDAYALRRDGERLFRDDAA
jgi:hypothetical protein